MELILKPYRNLYAAIAGRSTRTEFWTFSLYYLVGIIALYAILFGTIGANLLMAGHTRDPAAIAATMAAGTGVFLVVFTVLAPWIYLTAIAQMALACRRMHDQGRSAWFLLFGIIPFLGLFIVLIFLFLPGTPGPNRYGADPREGDTTSDVFR
jgi:uncharacterized membrane protein YhaH (DUF805 family)